MAYFQPGRGMEENEKEYNLTIYHLFARWIKLQTKTEAQQLRKLELFGVLRTLFGVWERCVIQLEAEGLWGEKERKLRDDVRQRVRLLQIAETDPVVKDQELKAWNKMWAIGPMEAEIEKKRKEVEKKRADRKKTEEKRAATRAKEKTQGKSGEEARKATGVMEVKGDGKNDNQGVGFVTEETVAPTKSEEGTHRKVDIS
jgi:hypothetical protein